MKKTAIAVVVSFLATGAYAGGLNLNSTSFDSLSINRIKTSKLELPVPAAEVKDGVKCGYVSGEITTKLYLYAQTAKNLLITTAKTEGEFKEFVDMWTPILAKFDIKVIGTEYKAGFGTLKYESANGMVVRDFLAEHLNYNALDPADMAQLQRELIESLEKSGMTPVASFIIKNEVFRPTFNIYYLAKPDENPDQEILLRQLMNGDGIDFDIVANAVQIVKKEASFSMVYVGKKLGFMSRSSSTEEGIKIKIEEYKKILKEHNMEFIGSKIVKVDPPDVSFGITINYIADIYFFQ